MRIANLAEAYGITRQRAYQLLADGIQLETLANPDALFRHLLSGKRTPLRQRLANPQTRAEIRAQIQSITKN